MDAAPTASDETDRFYRFCDQLMQAAAAEYHRYLVVFAGTPSWGERQAQRLLAHAALAKILWISNDAAAGTVPAARAKQLLGHEHDAVVYNAHAGFDPDAFGASASTISGGGLFLLLTPPMSVWPARTDPDNERIAVWPYHASDVSGRFVRRIARILSGAAGVFVIREDQVLPSFDVAAGRASLPPASDLRGQDCRTIDQQQAVQAILHVVSGHRRRPLVLTSDRGRGKSAALGIAAAYLARSQTSHIIVSAPRLSCVDNVFAHACRLLPHAQQQRGRITYRDCVIEFVAPDELLRVPRKCTLLMIDEAAAIPAPVLEELLNNYSRLVFATTIHGYEGTGRGFAVRFQQVLRRETPQWKPLQLTTPIRWAPGDPLERLVFDALLLAADAGDDAEVQDAAAPECEFERIDRDGLLQDETTLAQLFGLLVAAHYQTQPSDLRYLLDGIDVTVFVLRYKGNVVATALTESDGALDAELAQQVAANRRRVRGHMLAQTLAYAGADARAPQRRYVRISRIAVHPALQRRGLGKTLLTKIVATLPAQYSAIGASFGANETLLRFWRECGFMPINLGVSRNAASGEHAALVLKPLTGAGRETVARYRAHFGRYLPRALAECFTDLSAELAIELLRGDADEPRQDLSEPLLQQLKLYANSLRGYEMNVDAIWELAASTLCWHDLRAILDGGERQLLVSKVLQHHSWSEVARRVQLPGRAVAENRLRAIVKKLIAALE